MAIVVANQIVFYLGVNEMSEIELMARKIRHSLHFATAIVLFSLAKIEAKL